MLSNAQTDPFKTSSEQGQLEIVQLLLSSGTDPDFSGNFTPLQAAIFGGFADIVQVLLDAGADVNKEVKNTTPLKLATEQGKPKIIQMLLEAGATPN